MFIRRRGEIKYTRSYFKYFFNQCYFFYRIVRFRVLHEKTLCLFFFFFFKGYGIAIFFYNSSIALKHFFGLLPMVILSWFFFWSGSFYFFCYHKFFGTWFAMNIFFFSIWVPVLFNVYGCSVFFFTVVILVLFKCIYLPLCFWLHIWHSTTLCRLQIINCK